MLYPGVVTTGARRNTCDIASVGVVEQLIRAADCCFDAEQAAQEQDSEGSQQQGNVVAQHVDEQRSMRLRLDLTAVQEILGGEALPEVEAWSERRGLAAVS